MTLTLPPVLRVLVAFVGSTETDITNDVLRLTVNRGRSRERETMSPGRCTIELWNYSGKYDPDNGAGPYYPNIRPNKIVRVLAFTASATTPFTIGSSTLGGGSAFGGGGYYEFPIFTGRLEGGTQTYAEGGLQPRVTWNAIDASKRLNRDRSTTGYGTAGDLTGERVAAVLDGATPTWPTGERDIGPGTKTVQYSEGDQGRYDYLLAVAAAEPGAFFIGANGWAIFRDANWAPTPALPALGYAPDEYTFSEIEITDDETEIYNAVTVTANAIADQVEEDISSQAEFGRSDLSVSTVLDTAADMDDLALTYLVAYSGPRRRVSSLRVDRSAADWRFFLEKELLDRVIVRHRPIYGGTFQQTSAIQGIQIQVNNSQDWELTWNLSPPLDIISNPNLLTANQSSMETSTAGWVAEPGYPNAPGNGFSITGRASGSVPLVGTYCLEGHAYGIPGIQASYITVPYTTVPVTVGHTYRGGAWVRSYWGSIYFRTGIYWYNSGGSNIGLDAGPYVGVSGGYADGVTEWRNATVEGIAPAGAAYAALEVYVQELGIPYGGSADYYDHYHYIDAAELRDTLVISPTTAYPATIARSVVIPTPTIIATPVNRTVTPATIARSVTMPAPTVTGTVPFTPTDITGLNVWWDFSVRAGNLWQDTSQTVVVTTDGQEILAVTDKSGAGNHITGGTSGTNPLYKTGIINGKSVGRFDGNDDTLFSPVAADPTQTVFIVAKKGSAVTTVSNVLFSFNSSGAEILTDSDVGSGWLYSQTAASATVVLGGTPTNTTCLVLRYFGVATANMDVFVNGGTANTFNPHDIFNSGNIFLGWDNAGPTRYGDFDVGEVLIYDTTLSLTDINRVGPYLATKWGFTWTTATP